MKVLSRENGVKLKVRGIVKELGGMVATFATSGWPDILACLLYTSPSPRD